MTSQFILLTFFVFCVCGQVLGSEQVLENVAEKTFLYFSYGSNLKTERMHKNNPSAKYTAIGKITDYRLDFIGYSKFWHGSPSTIVPTNNSIVWGVVWETDMTDLPKLDKQELVNLGVYFAKNVTVTSPNGDELNCRTYQQTQLPEYVKPNELPYERQPSPAYLDRVVEGAKEHNLPDYYLEFLKSFRHNNYYGDIEIP